jgi:ABC-type multidrug transport system ATPase subunit
MTTREELIRLTDVEKRYGRQSVLRIERLSIREGDRILLTGSNGSGKSTLLKLLAHVAPVNRGQIRWSPTLTAESVGFVPQHGGLYGELTIHDNFDLRRGLYGKERIDAAESADVRALGLAPLLDKRFDELSGGYQRLAAVAAALHVDPTWLILDEPFGGVERPYREAILGRLAQRDRRLRLLVVASPTPDEFPEANRRIELEAGKVECSER